MLNPAFSINGDDMEYNEFGERLVYSDKVDAEKFRWLCGVVSQTDIFKSKSIDIIVSNGGVRGNAKVTISVVIPFGHDFSSAIDLAMRGVDA